MPRSSTKAQRSACAGRASPHSARARPSADRKSTRLNSSHLVISYAVFCLKKKQMHPQKWPAEMVNYTYKKEPSTNSVTSGQHRTDQVYAPHDRLAAPPTAPSVDRMCTDIA